jgi:4'-phosphopantetheinyl transferase
LVHWWPARLPRADAGVFVIGVESDGDRALARRRIRAALCEALAQLAGVPTREIRIDSTPGCAPAASFAGAPARAAPGIAITHEGALSLAAINLNGEAGIDLMRVQDVPDAAIVARDYLGPGLAAELAAMAPGRRAAAFARAWTEREARLKCLGLQLAEWTLASARQAAPCRCVPLALPDGLVGTLAIL